MHLTNALQRRQVSRDRYAARDDRMECEGYSSRVIIGKALMQDVEEIARMFEKLRYKKTNEGSYADSLELEQ